MWWEDLGILSLVARLLLKSKKLQFSLNIKYQPAVPAPYIIRQVEVIYRIIYYDIYVYKFLLMVKGGPGIATFEI